MDPVPSPFLGAGGTVGSAAPERILGKIHRRWIDIVFFVGPASPSVSCEMFHIPRFEIGSPFLSVSVPEIIGCYFPFPPKWLVLLYPLCRHLGSSPPVFPPTQLLPFGQPTLGNMFFGGNLGKFLYVEGFLTTLCKANCWFSVIGHCALLIVALNHWSLRSVAS